MKFLSGVTPFDLHSFVFCMTQIFVARRIDSSLIAHFELQQWSWWFEIPLMMWSLSFSLRSSAIVNLQAHPLWSFPSTVVNWLLDHHAHTLLDLETCHQSSGNVVVSLFIILCCRILFEKWSSLWKSCLCEHVAWNDMIHLEMGRIISIFIFSWNETVSNKDREWIWLCHSFYEDRLPSGFVKTDLWSDRDSF